MLPKIICNLTNHILSLIQSNLLNIKGKLFDRFDIHVIENLSSYTSQVCLILFHKKYPMPSLSFDMIRIQSINDIFTGFKMAEPTS